MVKWSTSAAKKIDEKTEGISSYNLHLFRIEEFKKYVDITGQFSTTCNGCKINKQAIEEVILKIDEAIGVPGKVRQEYDRLLGHLTRHVIKTHRIYPRNYFRNLYSFWGMIAGFLIGFSLFKVSASLSWELFATGLFCASLTGYFRGIQKDRKVKQNNSDN